MDATNKSSLLAVRSFLDSETAIEVLGGKRSRGSRAGTSIGSTVSRPWRQ
jgi:hypothetical protein